jgi:hypothetical protein
MRDIIDFKRRRKDYDHYFVYYKSGKIKFLVTNYTNNATSVDNITRFTKSTIHDIIFEIINII